MGFFKQLVQEKSCVCKQTNENIVTWKGWKVKSFFSFALQDRCAAALARVERTDFLYPMFIGEVAHVSAEITYTSKHSVEVQVNVVSENILTG